MTKSTILCVDDEPTILKSIKSQLKRNFGSQYSYEFADSPDEGLEVIDELVDHGAKIILIVSDWLMPGMKGDEFLIRVHNKYPNVVKIMLTGQADAEAVKRAEKEANLMTCLLKPWKEEDLVRTIQLGIDKIDALNKKNN